MQFNANSLKNDLHYARNIYSFQLIYSYFCYYMNRYNRLYFSFYDKRARYAENRNCNLAGMIGNLWLAFWMLLKECSSGILEKVVWGEPCLHAVQHAFAFETGITHANLKKKYKGFLVGAGRRRRFCWLD